MGKLRVVEVEVGVRHAVVLGLGLERTGGKRVAPVENGGGALVENGWRALVESGGGGRGLLDRLRCSHTCSFKREIAGNIPFVGKFVQSVLTDTSQAVHKATAGPESVLSKIFDRL